MSKYHSRSPEEFRRYLDNLSQSSKTRSWKNLIYFIDLALLIFIFYMVSKIINPAIDIQLKSSTKANIDKLEIYFAKSNIIDKDLSNYFLFIKNNENKIFEFKETKAIFYLLNEMGEECLKKEINFFKKNIPPNSLESISFSIPKVKKENLPKNCKGIYKKPPFPKTIDTIFDFDQKYRIDSYLKLKVNESKVELILTDENWK
jgi:hypothetical protein